MFTLADANPHAKKLYDDLLSNYNRLIRPVSNNTEKLTVKLGLKLSQLIDVVKYIEVLLDLACCISCYTRETQR